MLFTNNFSLYSISINENKYDIHIDVVIILSLLYRILHGGFSQKKKNTYQFDSHKLLQMQQKHLFTYLLI